MAHPTADFRNVDAARSDAVVTWPFEALAETLERGLMSDWRPILEEIGSNPWGVVARRVERWTGFSEEDAAAGFFDLVLTRARDRRESAEREEVARRIRRAVEHSGLTAADFARMVGTSASRLSTYATGRVMPSAAMLLRIERTAAGDQPPEAM